MIVHFHSTFYKKMKKLTTGQRKKMEERIAIFADDPFASILNNHPLQGPYDGYRSINVSGNLRALYKLVDSNNALFVTVDTHSNLY